MKDVVTIDTLDDLKKILFVQRQTTGKAKEELLNIVNDGMLDDDPTIAEERRVKQFMKQEGELLGQWADRATLTEWKQAHALTSTLNGWGNTFGVALLVGELFFEPIRRSYPMFSGTLRNIFVALLQAEMTALKNAGDSDIVQDLVMRFNINGQDGKPITDEKVKEEMREQLRQVIAALLNAGFEYGVFTMTGEEVHHAITHRGQRVLFHLMDIQSFVNVMAAAHKRFQSETPVLQSALADRVEKARKKPLKSRKQKA